ncbi:MAG: hypothetical protein IJF73_03025 [Clostridia bacterium]|nr:hypothetical protein [Clostridia bacterium]
MLKELLSEKNYLPILTHGDGTPVTRKTWEKRRGELRRLLETYAYGKTPAVDVTVRAAGTVRGFYTCAGKCTEERVTLVYTTPNGEGSFPVQIFTPTAVPHPPVILHIAFGEAPHCYIPVEEIVERGWALAVLDYAAVVNDRGHGDFSDGVAAHFGTTAARAKDEWGKIGMWAFAASRVLDYLIAARPGLNTERCAVIGHSRLGKTALWCGALDPRFFAVISNNSGYGGAASSKHGAGERITDFLKAGSWDWFCEAFKDYADREDDKPYDQSFLLSLIAPRYLLVGSAELDSHADPASEFLTTLHASPVWELLGERGLVTPDELPKPGAYLGEGSILYHYRRGTHYLSREDWAAYLDFLDSKR